MGGGPGGGMGPTDYNKNIASRESGKRNGSRGGSIGGRHGF